MEFVVEWYDDNFTPNGTMLSMTSYQSSSTSMPPYDNVGRRYFSSERWSTHSLFMFNKRFETRVAPKKTSHRLDTVFRDMVLRGWNGFGWVNYEKQIDTRDVCDLDNKLKSTHKTEDDASKKVIALFYPFCVVDDETQQRRCYLYLKTESSPAFSLTHAKKALSHYVAKHRKETNYSTRREDANEYDPEDRERDTQMYLNFTKTTPRSVSYYNNHVRGGNELFLPRSIWKLAMT